MARELGENAYRPAEMAGHWHDYAGGPAASAAAARAQRPQPR
ncbi:MAG TPA: hypothetical protein VF070_37835 [Streptosporangiaceae bacterium]